MDEKMNGCGENESNKELYVFLYFKNKQFDTLGY